MVSRLDSSPAHVLLLRVYQLMNGGERCPLGPELDEQEVRRVKDAREERGRVTGKGGGNNKALTTTINYSGARIKRKEGPSVVSGGGEDSL